MFPGAFRYLVPALVLSAAASAGENRVALPENYREQFTRYADVDRANPAQIAVIFANDKALASAADGAPLDYGSVLVMEIWKAKMKGEDEPELGPDGRRIKDGLAAVVVMEKQRGWGAIYPEDQRSGEWEFAAYTPDGQLKDIDYAAKCSFCHAPLGEQDYVQSWEALHAAARAR